MKILCLVDRYYPDSSANTICCDNIAEILKEKGHSVDFLAIKNSPDDKDFDIYNGSNVIKIETYQHRLLRKYGEKYHANKWMDFPWAFRRFHGVLQKVKIPFKPLTTGLVSLDTLNVKDIIKKVISVGNHYDCLITYSMPFEFILVSKKLIEAKVAEAWYPIFLDSYVNNEILSKRKLSFRKRLAEKTLEKANHIFMVDGIIKGNVKKGFNPEYHKKTTEIFIPMLKKFEIKKAEQKPIKTTICYCGGFYRDIRNPKKMLKILSGLDETIKIKWLGHGCEDIVKKELENFKGASFEIMGRVPHEKCVQEMVDADLLINLGNTVSNQMPSKIFEYIGMGKPIINFYFNEQDMCLPILEKYPLGLNINLNNSSEKDIETLSKFIKENKGKQLSYEEATKNLEDYKIENVAKTILDIIEK